MWTPATILGKLHNPIYCGRGRLNRWIVEWVEMTDEGTGEKYEVRTIRARDEDEENAYLPIKEGALPVLIEPALFDRVQAMLEQRKPFTVRQAARAIHTMWA
jgi:Recombinase